MMYLFYRYLTIYYQVNDYQDSYLNLIFQETL